MVVLGTRPVMILLVAFLALLGPAYSFSSSSMTQPRKIRLERRIRLDEHEMRALGGENALQQGNDHTGASSQQVQMAASSNVALTSSELAVPDVTGIAEPFVATAAPAKLDATVPATHSPLPAALPPSAAAQWHVERRRAILTKYPEVRSLMEPDSRGVPLLVAANSMQLWLTCSVAPKLWHSSSILGGPWATVALALTLGGTLSLVQFSVLHDVLHGGVVKHPKWKKILLWAGSLPAVFGYFLYLRSGHLSHHAHVGQGAEAGLGQLFSSSRNEFEDGDVLFVAHRQQLQGEGFPMSISSKFFGQWQSGAWRRNMALYCVSMLLERALLAINDKVVAITGKNTAFFPNKPASFHSAGATHARLSAIVQLACYCVGGWPALIYLWLAEVAWQLPTHPACAMFVSNHETRHDGIPPSSSSSSSSSSTGTSSSLCPCQPSTSVYLGKWYDVATVCANYHVEHHDFPEVPLLKLPALRKMAPDFYTPGLAPPLLRSHTSTTAATTTTTTTAAAAAPSSSSPYVACEAWWPTVKNAFAEKRFYACTGPGTLLS